MRVAPYNVAFGLGMQEAGQPGAAPINKPDTVTFSQKPAPKFGCRLFAYMGSDSGQGQDSLLENCLLRADNSLLNQSRKRTPQMGPGRVYSWDDLQVFPRTGEMPHHAQGWGVACYPGGAEKTPWVQKSVEAAVDDPAYTQSVRRAIAEKPATLLGHIRVATSGGVADRNSHPFQYGNWTFMHNGGTHGAVTGRVREQVKTTYAQKLERQPDGETDSEAVFYYFLGKLTERFPQASVQSLKDGLNEVDPLDMLSVFKDVVNEMKEDVSTPTTLLRKDIADKAGLRLTEVSWGKGSPACNYVVTNGNVMMASAERHKLYVGVRQPGLKSRLLNRNAGAEGLNREVVLASEIIQPKGLFADKLNWIEVMPGDCVLLERKPNGVAVTMAPL